MVSSVAPPTCVHDEERHHGFLGAGNLSCQPCGEIVHGLQKFEGLIIDIGPFVFNEKYMAQRIDPGMSWHKTS